MKNASSSSWPYHQAVELEGTLNNSPLRYISKPGLPNWREILPSTDLLAAHVHPTAGQRILILGCRQGALAVTLSRLAPGLQLVLLDRSAIALEMSRRTLRANQVEQAQLLERISLPSEEMGTFDLACMDLPKGRKLARRWLLETFSALRPGGHLYLAGANDLGIQSVIKDAGELFGPGALLGYKKGSRVARFQKEEIPSAPPEWASEPGVAPGTWREVVLKTPHGPLSLLTLPGVFSRNGLDEGTALLLNHLDLSSGSRFVDLGCGLGVIGLSAAKMGASFVHLLDADLLAVAAARQNLSRLGLPNAMALASDVLQAVEGQTFDQIATNPPFHAGKAVEYLVAQEFIRQSWQVLEPGGQLWLVANRFIRYEQAMEPYFTKVESIAETGKYHLLLGTK